LNGTACDDGQICTRNDTCITGVCTGFGGCNCGDGFVSVPYEDCEPPGTGCCDASCHFMTSATVCRSARGDCDMAEYCPGNSSTCPTDKRYNATTVCRPTVDPLSNCDPAEYCTGTTDNCPADVRAMDNTSCSSTDTCLTNTKCVSGICQGYEAFCVGVCGDGYKSIIEQCKIAAFYLLKCL
jgi:hypothetical protein